jgi:hypothetical protein
MRLHWIRFEWVLDLKKCALSVFLSKSLMLRVQNDYILLALYRFFSYKVEGGERR